MFFHGTTDERSVHRCLRVFLFYLAFSASALVGFGHAGQSSAAGMDNCGRFPWEPGYAGAGAGSNCERVTDGFGETPGRMTGPTCITYRIPRYYRWRWDDPAHDPKRYEAWKYGYCEETTEDKADAVVRTDIPQDAVRKISVAGGTAIEYLPSNRWLDGYRNNGALPFSVRLHKCPAGQATFDGKCWKRVLKDRIFADGASVGRTWVKTKETVELTYQNPPSCTPVMEWKKDGSGRMEKRPKIAETEVCRSVRSESAGMIRLRFERLPCTSVSSFDLRGVPLPGWGAMTTTREEMDGRFPRLGDDVWAFDADTMITLTEAKALCESLTYKTFESRADFAAVCGTKAEPENTIPCPNAPCELPGDPAETLRITACRPSLGTLGFRLPSELFAPGPVKLGSSCQWKDEAEAPKGIVFRDKDTAWPKVYCPMTIETVVKCDGGDATVTGAGTPPPGGEPIDPLSGKCPAKRPIWLGGSLCVCQCPAGYLHDQEKRGMCRSAGGALYDSCDPNIPAAPDLSALDLDKIFDGVLSPWETPSYSSHRLFGIFKDARGERRIMYHRYDDTHRTWTPFSPPEGMTPLALVPWEIPGHSSHRLFGIFKDARGERRIMYHRYDDKHRTWTPFSPPEGYSPAFASD